MNIYILKSYRLDYIYCIVFVRVMGYKYLLSDAHSVTALLICRRGVGEEGYDNDLHHHGPNPKDDQGGG